MKRKVWIYCRTAQRDADALISQQELLKNYARKCCMTVKGITAEYGSGSNMGRKGLDEVYGAAKRGEMDCVLVASMTRLGRVILDTTEYVSQLKECGVRVICADGLTIDDHTGILLRELVREAKACNYCGNA